MTVGLLGIFVSSSGGMPLENSKQAYSVKDAKTNNIHESIQASMAVRPSALGVFVVTVLKMLTRTKKSVTNRAMRPRKHGKYRLCRTVHNGRERS